MDVAVGGAWCTPHACAARLKDFVHVDDNAPSPPSRADFSFFSNSYPIIRQTCPTSRNALMPALEDEVETDLINRNIQTDLMFRNRGKYDILPKKSDV